MAKIDNGYMGAFNGKLGPAVGYKWKGRSCLRALNLWPRNPRTRKQQAGRMVFGTTSSIASGCRLVSRIGLRGLASERKISETSVFISLNRQHVSYENGEVTVDYPSLQFSYGDLPSVAFGHPQVEGDRQIGVDISILPDCAGDLQDLVFIVAYSPGKGRAGLSRHSLRCENHVSIRVDWQLASSELHLYGFVWDKGSRASNTTYLGSITL